MSTAAQVGAAMANTEQVTQSARYGGCSAGILKRVVQLLYALLRLAPALFTGILKGALSLK
jgi:hypothetical protein